MPQTTDLLNTNKQTMIALAKLCADLFGTATMATGLACVTTTPASMSVNVNPGQIYQLANVDGTAYSAILADTTHSILKQGILMDAQSFTLTAPGTVGYSQNYLIQATYLDTDTNNSVLPYYNSANPTQAFNGPGGNGTSQPTTRAGQVSLQLVAGTAAATGSQTTPAVTTGYVGLWVITVANGQSTITSSNIAQYAGAPFFPGFTRLDGSTPFTATQQGVTPAQFDVTTKLATMAALQRALGSWSGVLASNTAPLNLTAANIGQLISYFATAGSTINLPASSSLIAGAAYRIYGANGCTIAANGSDTIVPYPGGTAAATLVVPAGMVVDVIYAGSGQWLAEVHGSGVLSKTANGYLKLPSGLIIQWGSATTSASADVAVTFPIAFPSAAASVSVIGTQGSPCFAGQNSLTATGFNVNAYTPGSARNATGVFWMAIGY